MFQSSFIRSPESLLIRPTDTPKTDPREHAAGLDVPRHSNRLPNVVYWWGLRLSGAFLRERARASASALTRPRQDWVSHSSIPLLEEVVESPLHPDVDGSPRTIRVSLHHAKFLRMIGKERHRRKAFKKWVLYGLLLLLLCGCYST